MWRTAEAAISLVAREKSVATVSVRILRPTLPIAADAVSPAPATKFVRAECACAKRGRTIVQAHAPILPVTTPTVAAAPIPAQQGRHVRTGCVYVPLG